MKLDSCKILIIQPAFLGDAILSLSLIELTHRVFPQASLQIVIRKGYEDLFIGHPYVDKIWSLDKKKKVFGLISLGWQLKKESFDLVLNLHRYFSGFFLTVFTGARDRIGFKESFGSFLFTQTVKHGMTGHEVERNQRLIRAYKRDLPLYSLKDLRPSMFFSPSDENQVKSWVVDKKPYFVLAPRSLWFTKQWPLDHWRSLAERLSKLGMIFWVGGREDAEIISSLSQGLFGSMNLAGVSSFRETSCLMKGALRVFVNDSSALHLATCANARVTAIYCSTVPEFGFFPLSDDSKVVQILPESLSCKPCGIHGHSSCPKGHFQCGKSLSVEQVFSTIF